MKKYKIIFTAQDPGGFNVICPVIKELKKDKKFDIIVILANQSREFAKKQNIKYLDANKLSLLGKPDLIFTATSQGDSIEKKLIAIAKDKKIPTISIIDFWSNYKIRFNKYLPDYILVIDEIMKKEMVKQGFPCKKIFITGNPFFDSFSKITESSKKKDFIVFFSQPFSEIYNNSFNEVQIFEDIVKALESIDSNKQIMVKFHPRSKKFDKFDEIIKNSKLKIRKEKKLCVEDLIKKAEIIVGINSIVLFQAAMMGKKVLSYQPKLRGPDPLISNRFGLSTPVYQKKELYPAFKKMFFQKPKNKKLKLIKKYTENKSTQKVISFINSLLENEK